VKPFFITKKPLPAVKSLLTIKKGVNATSETKNSHGADQSAGGSPENAVESYSTVFR
jgi:hypothetical protein